MKTVSKRLFLALVLLFALLALLTGISTALPEHEEPQAKAQIPTVKAELSLEETSAASISYGSLVTSWDVSATSQDKVKATLYNDPKTYGYQGYYILAISGAGNMKDWSPSSSCPWYGSYSDKIKYAVIEDGVTTIGDSTFYNCATLSDVTVPESITSVGNSAFYGCESLESINIPEGVSRIGGYAFYGCLNLTSVSIPSTVASIGSCAFKNCSRLSTLNIGNGVNYVGSSAFDGCDSLSYNKYDNAFYLGNSENPYTVLVEAKSYAITSVSIHENTKVICDNAFYSCQSLTTVNSPAGLRFIGYNAFAYCGALSEFDIGKEVHYIDINAFLNCTNLKSIVIPLSVITINKNAFLNCTGLAIYCESDSKPEKWDTDWNPDQRPVTWGYTSDPNGKAANEWNISATASDSVIARLYADPANEGYYKLVISGSGEMNSFAPPDYAPWYSSYKSTIKSVIIENGVTSVGKFAFYDCESLSSVVISDSVTIVDDFAFELCTGLASVTLGNGVSTIGEWAFYLCKSLPSITIPASVTTICDYAFCLCSTLANVTIPNSVISIGSEAFSSCTALTSVTIPNSVTSIGSEAFSGCTALTSVAIGNGVTTIGDKAFENCRSLAGVTIGNRVTSIGKHAFYNCDNLTDIVIPDSVTIIGDFAFELCTSLTSAAIGNGVTTIGEWVFESCTSLASVTIGNSVTSIGADAFSGCTSLTSIIIPDNVESIGFWAFKDCTNLRVYCEAASQPEGWNADWNPVPCPVVWGYVRANVLTNLTLGSMLSVNAFVNVDDAEGVTVRFTMGEKIATVSGVYDAGTGRYKFTFEGVWPTNIGDTIVIEVFKDGALIASVNDYSVKGYCENLLGMSKEELGLSDAKYAAIRTLICDLLDYGAAAQKYTDYKTDALVNEGIEGSSEFTPLTWTDMKVSYHKTVDGTRFTAANLYFNNANQLIFKFRAADVEKLTLRLFVNGVITYYTADDFVNNDGVYSFYTDKIRATEFDDVYYATLIYDGVEVQTLAYSVRSYVYSKQSASNTTLAELVRATYKYGLSAKAYAQAN